MVEARLVNAKSTHTDTKHTVQLNRYVHADTHLESCQGVFRVDPGELTRVPQQCGGLSVIRSIHLPEASIKNGQMWGEGGGQGKKKESTCLLLRLSRSPTTRRPSGLCSRKPGISTTSAEVVSSILVTRICVLSSVVVESVRT